MKPTADHSANTPEPPSPQPPVRLTPFPHPAARGGYEGAWWPYSHNLTDELPVLLQAMNKPGVVTRVTVDIEVWPDVPHQMVVDGHRVSVGWSASGYGRNEITLSSYRHGCQTLRVIPPGTVAGTAGWLMTTPVPAGGTHTPTQLLATATQLRAPEHNPPEC